MNETPEEIIEIDGVNVLKLKDLTGTEKELCRQILELRSELAKEKSMHEGTKALFVNADRENEQLKEKLKKVEGLYLRTYRVVNNLTERSEKTKNEINILINAVEQKLGTIEELHK
ncbi:hypothetical protein IJX73_02790 [bacterium]|nr:hypothetical protein [bacterium]